MVNIEIIIEDSMKDMKLKRKLSGLGGAACLLCCRKPKDWTSLEYIVQGFPITRSADQTWKLFEQLVNEDGEIETEANDFEARKGLTQEPLTISDQRNITLTHAYINNTRWFVKLLTRCHIDYRNWIRKTDSLCDLLKNAHKRVVNRINENI